MKRLTWPVIVGCLTLLGACNKPPASAPAPLGAPPASSSSATPGGAAEAAGRGTAAMGGASRGPNERFYTVQGKLDPGGSFYFYADVKDVLKDGIDSIKKALPGMGLPPQDRAPLETALGEVERAGFFGVHDVGMSMVPDGALHRTKFFVSLPEGRKGVFALLGGEAHAIDALDYAPADTLLFDTSEVDLSGLLEFLRGSIKDVGGDQALAQFNQQLAMAGAMAGVDVDALIRSLGGRFTIVATLDPAAKLTIPMQPQPVQLDSPELALIVDTKDTALYDAIKSVATRQNMAAPETAEGDRKQFALNVPANPVWAVKPVVASDGGHLYLATHAEYLNKVMAAKKSGGGLAQAAEFKSLSEGLPQQGNGMTFSSAKVMQAYQQIATAMLAALPPEQRAAQEMVMKDMMGAKPGSGGFSIRINQPDGILFASRSAQGGGQMMAAAVAAPVAILAAIAVPNFLEAQTRAKVSRVRSDLRSMATALESYYIDYNAYPPTGETRRLTSPVAYLSRPFADAFAPHEEEFRYASPPGTAGWITWSCGPDGVYDLTPQNIAQAYNPRLPLGGAAIDQPGTTEFLIQRTFDPTNGTTSAGDIWRVKQ